MANLSLLLKRIGDLQALAVSDLVFAPGMAMAFLYPRPLYVAKVPTFSPGPILYCRPFAILPSRKGSICVTYVHRAAQWRKADQLFVCFGPPRIGDPATKSRWVIETITLAYESSGLPSPMRVREHSTRSMAASKALSLDVALQDVCAVAQDVCAVVPERLRLRM